MMVLKVIFTRAEIENFFRANGFTVVPHKRGSWTKEYHNRDEYYEVDIPGIVVNDRVVDAEKVFEKVVEHRLKKTVAPVNSETKRIITQIAKKQS